MALAWYLFVYKYMHVGGKGDGETQRKSTWYLLASEDTSSIKELCLATWMSLYISW